MFFVHVFYEANSIGHPITTDHAGCLGLCSLQTSSLLEDIPTIGPATRKKLIKTFGSMRGVMQARDFELEKVVGVKRAAILKQYIHAEHTRTKPSE